MANNTINSDGDIITENPVTDIPTNSLASKVAQYVRLNTNAIDTYSKISEAVYSDKDNVTLTILKDDHSRVNINIPTFGWMVKELERLNLNFENLSSFSGQEVAVQLADGTFQKVIKSELLKEANDISGLEVPSKFNTKSNWFFEDFLNPQLYIALDFSDKIDIATEDVKVKRYILDLSESVIQEHFDNNFKGSSSINHDLFNSFLTDNNISYELDEDIVKMPPRTVNYEGNFSVISILKDANDNKNIYQLNKLSYTDLKSGVSDGLMINTGDTLKLNNTNTRYTITAIDKATKTIKVNLMDGRDILKVGANVLSIYKGYESDLSTNINIGFDENLVIFVKGINPISKIESKHWSNGIGFSSNELTIIDSAGKHMSLADYYDEYVVDFGRFIHSYQLDNVPPSAFGVTPNAPELDSRDFRVTSINDHLTGSDAFKNVQDLQSTKEEAESKVKAFDTELKAQRDLMSNKEYSTDAEYQADRTVYRSLVNDRETESTLFASVVRDIKSTINDTNLVNVSPKYRVRGFWEIPQAQTHKSTGDQKVIGFILNYRYLTKSGDSSNTETFDFGSEDSKKRGTFSDWIEMKSPVLIRALNASGKYEWVSSSVENGDLININQLDIPINYGETVEVRIKSVSEAGYPSNSMMSEWSNSIRINFPDSLNKLTPLGSIIKENLQDLSKIKMWEELQGLGVFSHVESSYKSGGKEYLHDANSISSGFFTPEQSPIALYDKLNELSNMISQLQTELSKTKGEMSVKVIAPDGTIIPVKINGTTNIFAGFYKNDVEGMAIKKGAIISKEYEVVIENIQAGPVELASLLPGSVNTEIYSSGDFFNNGNEVSSVVDNNLYFMNNGRYDYVPVNYMSELDQLQPYQGRQTNGQSVYVRLKSIDGAHNNYSDIDLDTNSVPANANRNNYEYSADSIPSTEVGGSTAFIWKYKYFNMHPELIDTSNVNDYANSLYVHKDHPIVADYHPAAFEYSAEVTTALSDINTNGKIVHNKYFKTTLNNAYFNDGNRAMKSQFVENDQYLLGGRSCGCYLFVKLNNKESLNIGGETQFSYKNIAMGSENAIRFPIVFQYRMTDYSGANDGGSGFIDGDPENSGFLQYNKTIGFDIKEKDNDITSFDLKFNVTYKELGFGSTKFSPQDLGNTGGEQ